MDRQKLTAGVVVANLDSETTVHHPDGLNPAVRDTGPLAESPKN